MKWINKLGWRFRQQYQHLFYWLEWRFSDERKNPYRCTCCASTDVEFKVWSKVNEGGRYSSDCEEYECSFCNSCDEYVRIRPTTDLLRDACVWWKKLDSQDMERIVAHHQVDFPTKEYNQKLPNFCNEWWHKLSTEEKIRTWINGEN